MSQDLGAPPTIADTDGAGDDRRHRRAPGRRRARLRRERRQRRRRGLRRALVALAAVLLVGAAATWTLDRDANSPQDATGAAPGGEPAGAQGQTTLLLVRHPSATAAGPAAGPASGATLLIVGPGPRAAVLFVPVGTLMEIPGFGLDRLGLAYQYQGPALVEATVENALGADIDAVAAISDAELGALLQRTGGYAVQIDRRLVRRAEDGTATVAFEPGTQSLDGAELADYWGFLERDDTELDTFTRQQAVLTGLFERLADPAALTALLTGPRLLDTDLQQDTVSGILARLASARTAGELSFHLLPVTPFGGRDALLGATYRIDQAGVRQLVQRLLGPSIPEGADGEPVRVQVLNGVGRPGVGQVVDRALEGGAFRIVLTDNARHFAFTETRIVIYDESDRSRDAARRVRERLGVGTILLSRQPQSVVDLTVVVGADLVGATASSPPAQGGAS